MSGGECLPLTSLSQVLEWTPHISLDEQHKNIQPKSSLNKRQKSSSVKRSSSCLPGSSWTCSSGWDELVSTPLQDTKGAPKTLVCHDMQGGYLQDRWADGTDEDGYYFIHWSQIDIFVYFSHNLLTIPPDGWISAAKMHGTTILGTIITEWDEGQAIMEELLGDEAKRNRFVSVCTDIAREKGFHGWLLNIENPIPEALVPSLLILVSSLTLAMKKAVPGGMVIWYDSVTMDGELKWQNELNENNKPFFDVCDGIFLNYTWKVGPDDTPTSGDKDIENSDTGTGGCESADDNCDKVDKTGSDISAGTAVNPVKGINNLSNSIDCLSDGSRRRDIFVGVDVFGRGCLGGGGFNCHQALSLIRQYGLSAAIFAPGWTYEIPAREGKQGDEFSHRELTFWKLLQPYLSFHGPHLKSPLVCGSGSQPHPVFQTCFSSGRGAATTAPTHTMANTPAWFNLKKMEFQPSFPSFVEVNEGENKCLCYPSTQHCYRPSQSLRVSGPRHSTVPLMLCRLEVEPATPTVFLLVLKGMEKNDVQIRLAIAGGLQIVLEKVEEQEMEEMKGKIEMPEEKEGWKMAGFLLDKGLVVEKIGVNLGSNEKLYLGHFSIHCLGTEKELPFGI